MSLLARFLSGLLANVREFVTGGMVFLSSSDRTISEMSLSRLVVPRLSYTKLTSNGHGRVGALAAQQFECWPENMKDVVPLRSDQVFRGLIC